MSKKTQKNQAAKKDVKKETKVTKAVAKVPEKKAEAPKAPEATKKQETKSAREVTQISMKNFADACDTARSMDGTDAGAFKEGSKFCKACMADYPKTAKACKSQTEQKASAKEAVRQEKRAKIEAGKGKRSGDRDVFGYRKETGAGQINILLMRKEGATMKEMLAIRGAASAHIAALKAKGFKLEKKGGSYYLHA